MLLPEKIYFLMLCKTTLICQMLEDKISFQGRHLTDERHPLLESGGPLLTINWEVRFQFLNCFELGPSPGFLSPSSEVRPPSQTSKLRLIPCGKILVSSDDNNKRFGIWGELTTWQAFNQSDLCFCVGCLLSAFIWNKHTYFLFSSFITLRLNGARLKKCMHLTISMYANEEQLLSANPPPPRGGKLCLRQALQKFLSPWQIETRLGETLPSVTCRNPCSGFPARGKNQTWPLSIWTEEYNSPLGTLHKCLLLPE